MCANKKISKRVFSTKILENSQIADKVYSMSLEYPEGEIAKGTAGQFVNLYLDRKDLLLPRPISICRLSEKEITLVYGIVGSGTEELKSYGPGSYIKVSSPLGRGYDLTTTSFGQALLIGGGLGIPPLLELSHRLKAMGIPFRLVLGFRSEPFLLEEFRKAGGPVHVATDDGSQGFQGTVLDLIKNYEFTKGQALEGMCFACGPAPMLKGVCNFLKADKIGLQVSLEERMACGFGSCLGCVCKIQTKTGPEYKRVCKDGPVFDGRQVVWDA